MQHDITTVIVNTPQGTPVSTDGVMMMVCKGIAVPGATIPLVLDTAYLCNSLASLATIGITPDYDYVNGLNVYQQASEFYAQAGDGALLWLVVTATTNVFNTYVATTTFLNLVRGTAIADPTKRAKMIGLCMQPPTTQQSTTDFSSEALATIAAFQASQTTLFPEGFSFSGIVDGANMSSTQTAAGLQSMATKNAPSISFCITGSRPNGTAAVGAALGRFARISIGNGFGKVSDGPVVNQTAYLTNGVTVPILGTIISGGSNITSGHNYMVVNGPVTYNGTVYSVGSIFTATSTAALPGSGTSVLDIVSTNTAAVTTGNTYLVLYGPVTYNGVAYQAGNTFVAIAAAGTFSGGIVTVLNATPVQKLFKSDFDNLGASQYMFLRTWFQQSGFYWNDGGTCALATTPLSTQEFNRVANALTADLTTFLIQGLMGANIPIDTKTGLASSSFVNGLITSFEQTYIDPLIASGDISSASLTLVGTPNGANTINWTYVLTIEGTPITGNVTGQIQFI